MPRRKSEPLKKKPAQSGAVSPAMREMISSAKPTTPAADWAHVNQLQLWTANPRKNAKTIEFVRTLIQRFGFTRTLIVQRGTWKILAGNTAFRAGILEKVEWFPIRWFDGSDEEAHMLALSDNRANELSAWDEQARNTIIREAAVSGVVVKGIGWSDDAIKRIVAGLPKPTKGRDAKESGKPKNPRMKVGEIWACGPHRIGAIDVFQEADLARLLGDRAGSIDCVLTDPPYAIFGSSTGIGRDIADDEMVRPFFVQVFRTIEAQIKKFGHAYVCCDWRSWASIAEGAKRSGIDIENALVWDKGGGGLGSMYAHCYEMIAFTSKLPKSKTIASLQERGKRMVTRPNILRVNRATGTERPHNASKPVALFEELITNSTEEGETVLDLFHGGGTTLVACENLGRVCFAADKDPGWVDVAIGRWETLTGERASKVA